MKRFPFARSTYQHPSLTSTPLSWFQCTMRLEAPIYCAASSSQRDFMEGPSTKNKLACICVSTTAATAYTKPAVRPRQRLYSISVRLHQYRCPGLTAPEAHAARRCPGNDVFLRLRLGFAASSCHEWWVSSVMHQFLERRHSWHTPQ
jgi:hypothetical protein